MSVQEGLEISVEAARDGLGGEGFVLVDIREAEELAIARIEGAVWIPLGELATRIHEVDAGEEGTIALICHSGRRSLAATVALQRAGMDEVRSVAGGIDAWSVRIDPGVSRY